MKKPSVNEALAAPAKPATASSNLLGGAMNPQVDWYFDKAQRWQQEVLALRALALDAGLTEELKWGCPCYTLGDANIVLIHMFKDYCALLFFKGALLKDAHGMLIQQTKNVQAARQIRFNDVGQVAKQGRVVKAYIRQAMAVEKSGLQVALKKTAEFEVPEEFASKLTARPALKKAFDALSPGRQRAYLLHFASAKQSQTREARVQKCMPQILDGKGLDD
jgi:uncharacterized protein YdeI (YjbR/CyaY-like superfamily)